MHDALRAAAGAGRADGIGAVLCTIVATRGSVPAPAGATMCVRADGTFVGTVGGGCLEHDVWAAARRVFDDGQARLITVDLTDYEALEQGLACGGSLEILCEGVTARVADECRRALTLADAGEPVVVWHRIPNGPTGPGALGVLAGADLAVAGADAAAGAGVGAAAPAARAGVNARILAVDCPPALLPAARRAADTAAVAVADVEGARIFLQPIHSPSLVLFGGGHVGQGIASAAIPCGFRVTVVDDREAFSRPESFVGANTLTCAFREAFARLRILRSTALLVVTRGHRYDEAVLRDAVMTDASYVGLIGSARKILGILQRLHAGGIPAERLARVVAPIGVSAGAETPAEIAAAVVAELVAWRRLGPEAVLRLNPDAAGVRAKFLAGLGRGAGKRESPESRVQG